MERSKKGFFSVTGMTCASCVGKIEREIKKKPGMWCILSNIYAICYKRQIFLLFKIFIKRQEKNFLDNRITWRLGIPFNSLFYKKYYFTLHYAVLHFILSHLEISKDFLTICHWTFQLSRRQLKEFDRCRLSNSCLECSHYRITTGRFFCFFIYFVFSFSFYRCVQCHSWIVVTESWNSFRSRRDVRRIVKKPHRRSRIRSRNTTRYKFDRAHHWIRCKSQLVNTSVGLDNHFDGA